MPYFNLTLMMELLRRTPKGSTRPDGGWVGQNRARWWAKTPKAVARAQPNRCLPTRERRRCRGLRGPGRGGPSPGAGQSVGVRTASSVARALNSRSR